MAKGRPKKEGLDFAGWEVGVLDNDAKVDRLIEAQGIAAFTVYFYLCQHAYATHGYYLDWDYSCCAVTARKLGKGASAEFVKNVVDMCLKCDLFDKQVFDAYGVLTSRGIQRRYSGAVERRVPDEEPKKFWLLENSQGFDECTQNSDEPPENSTFCNRNSIDSTVHNSTVNDITLHDNTNTSTSAKASGDLSPKEVVELFNRLCPSLPKVISLTDSRRTAIRQAGKKLGGFDKFEEFFKRIEASDFLTGRNQVWKNCGFDWCLKAGNLVKIQEGQYDNKTLSKSEEDREREEQRREIEEIFENRLPVYQKKK